MVHSSYQNEVNDLKQAKNIGRNTNLETKENRDSNGETQTRPLFILYNYEENSEK